MSAASDRTTYLKYCVSGPKTCVCCPTTDISGQTVIADISGQTVIADISGQTVTANLNTTDGLGDAFSRLRVSNPYTLFEFNSITGKNPTIIDEQVTGAASSTDICGDSYINMAVTGAGGSVIRQSHDYIPYQPGKSRLVLMTGVLYTNPNTVSQLTARIGSFDMTIGGVYVEMKNGVISVNLAKLTGADASGTTTVLRSAWTDRLDGSGPSGVTVDFSKAQIYLFDFEWLGVGQVRCGIVQGGAIHYYYIFKHDDVDFLTSPYVQMAKLPLRYEITSTGSTNSMRMICGTVISEGGFSPPGRPFYASLDTSTTGKVVPNNSTFHPIMGIRLRPGNPYNRGTIKLLGVDVFNTNSNIAGSWKILLNPTFSGGTETSVWSDYDAANGSIAQIRYYNWTVGNAPTLNTFNLVLNQSYYTSRSNSTFISSIDELVAAKGIASNIAGTSDEFVLVVNWLVGSNNSNVYASLRWTEIV